MPPAVDKRAVDAPLVALFGVSVAVKLLLLPSYTSTDFEVHRNWLAVTHSLPPAQWYHEATSEWTLDYPPFFAYFEYALSLVAARVDPALVTISATPVFSARILLFQRLSVIVSDAVLFYAVYAYCTSWPSVTTTESAFSRHKRLVVMLLTTLDAGLLYVDHIHFQYNGMLLGLLLLSAAKLRLQQDLQGALLYAVLLMFKHIYLYAAPLYFVYLLGHHCYAVATPRDTERTRTRSLSNTDVHETIQSQHDGNAAFSLFRFLRLGVLVLVVFAVAFGSVLYAHPDPLAGLQQIASRLFPVQRGLVHAYWAPNVWALYAFLDKALVLLKLAPAPAEGVALMSGGLVQEASFAVLASVPPLVCAVLTFASMVPVLYTVWRYPDSSLFMSALVYCMHCSFMLGYHVHEKAILQVLLPLALLAAESVNDMRLYRFASIASSISLFPLLFTPAEQLTKVLIALVHALVAFVTLNPLLKDSLKQRHIRATAVGLRTFEKLYLALLACVAAGAMLFPYFPGNIGAKYPFLPLMAISVTCAVANVYVWGFALTQHFRKLEAVKSYLLPTK
jgi:alpha-1,3-glucosyltransferase